MNQWYFATNISENVSTAITILIVCAIAALIISEANRHSNDEE